MAASLVGKTLGTFAVESELGSGGMGVVLLARQSSLDRQVVLKRIRRDLGEYPELAERFAREARAAGRIHHQNVVAVYDQFTWRGDAYIAQEYVDGVDLASALLMIGAMPWRIAALVALEVTRGLEEIHGQGTVHRDLKPANILLGRRGEVKIADFGLALEATASTLTAPGVMIGSPSYMPPEQMLGERVDGRCDLFAVGVMLYEMLSGQVPYPHHTTPPARVEAEVESQAETAEADRSTESLLSRMQKEHYRRLRRVAPRTPRALARLVKRCLKARPQKRLQSVSELRRCLELGLGNPSPADGRAELATYLWGHQLFAPRDQETVVRLQAPEVAGRPRGMRAWVGALAAGLALLTAASTAWIDYQPLLEGRAPQIRPGVTPIHPLLDPMARYPGAKSTSDDAH